MGFAPSDIVIAAGAVLGALVAFEAVNLRRQDPAAYEWTRLILLVWVAGVAAIEAESGRGFAYLTLMPIGAYAVAKAIAAPIARRIVRRVG